MRDDELEDDAFEKELKAIINTPESPAEKAEERALIRNDLRFMVIALFIACIGVVLYLAS